MENQQLIEKALKFEGEMNFEVAARLAEFSEIEINYAKIFWEPAFNNSWMYLSDEIITDWMGKKKTKDSIRDFRNDMRKHYMENVDYKEVDFGNPLVQKYLESCPDFFPGKKHNKKYYIITGHTLKKMLMKAGSKKGSEICDYFIKTETLAKSMCLIQLAISERKMKELEEENKSLLHKNQLADDKLEKLNFKRFARTNDQTVYIISSHGYALEGMFKIGRTKGSINRRIAELNTGRAPGDSLKLLHSFKVSDCAHTEKLLHNKLDNLRVEKNREFFRCPFDMLVEICEFLIQYDNLANEAVDKFVGKLRSETSINWTRGVDMKIFEEILLLDNTPLAEFDLTFASLEQIDLFIAKCMEIYQNTYTGEPLWKNMKDVICKITGMNLRESQQFKPFFRGARDKGKIKISFREIQKVKKNEIAVT